MEINEITVNRVYGVRAESREALINAVQPNTVSFAFGMNPTPPALFIAMPCCGEVRCWMDKQLIPVHDVGPCSCGNWFIKYGKFAESGSGI